MTQRHQFHRPDLEAADTLAASRQLHHDLQRIIPVDSVIFDVGANRGQFAEEILRVAPDAKIYSFEPVPEAYDKLKLLSERHPQVMPVKQAVSLRAG